MTYVKCRCRFFNAAALCGWGLTLLLFSTSAANAAADDAFARKPYMGWSSWSFYQKTVTEAAIKAHADVVAEKLKAYGYEYVNVDDYWQKGFDEHGYWKANPDTFPSGIPALADYVHKKGLKFGIYLVPGIPKALYDQNPTVVGTTYHIQDFTDSAVPGSTKSNTYKIDYSKPGSDEYIRGFAKLLASWGVDFIKMDFVGPGGGNRPADTRDDLRHWAAALKATGRPIWMELSNSLKMENIADWKATSNGWRIGHDLEAYHTPFLTGWSHVSVRFAEAPLWAKFAGPGGWNDFDSLELGNGDADGLTLEERRSVMTLWAISAAPLSLGSDLTKLDAVDYGLLTNREVIAVDQAGRVALPLSQDTPQQVWQVQNADKSYTVALFNLANQPAAAAVTWRDLGVSGAATVRDLWTHTDLGSQKVGFTATLAPHGCRLLRVTPNARR